MSRSESFSSAAEQSEPVAIPLIRSASGATPAPGGGPTFKFNGATVPKVAPTQTTAYREGKHKVQDWGAPEKGETFKFGGEGKTNTHYVPLTDNEGYPRGFNPARQREVISALSVNADDIRKFGHRAVEDMRQVHNPTDNVGSLSATKFRRQKIASTESQITSNEKILARPEGTISSVRADEEGKYREKVAAANEQLRTMDHDDVIAKSAQQVEDAAASHPSPSMRTVLVKDERKKLGPMEMEELKKSLPPTKKKRDKASRYVTHAKETSKARAVEAIARSTVPAEDLQGMKEAQIERGQIDITKWQEHVPTVLRNVVNTGRYTGNVVKLNMPQSSGTLGWVEHNDLGKGPVNITRHSEPTTRVVQPPTTDENGRTTGSLHPVGSRVAIPTWRGSLSVNNAERQLFYPIPKGTPKKIAQRRREASSRVSETLIHELGHASADANANISQINPTVGVASDANPYRPSGAPGAAHGYSSSGVMEAVAENYTDRHWRPDPRFFGPTRHSSNYDHRYNTRYGRKNGANPDFRKTYAANRIDMTSIGKNEALTEDVKAALGGDDG